MPNPPTHPPPFFVEYRSIWDEACELFRVCMICNKDQPSEASYE